MIRTLENRTLLYDADCPLCRGYTKGFIYAGMLDENGKKPYCLLSQDEQHFIDIKRASNEIALVDNINKTAIYGIDSLLKVIGFSFPWIEKIGNCKPIKFFLKKLYSFISYNRKVIVPSKINNEIKLQCIPDFNYKYRLFYIAFAWLACSILFYKFTKLLNLEKVSLIFVAILLLFQLLFQCMFLLEFTKEKIINYAGNLITISLFGSFILTPILILNQIININLSFNFIYFAATVAIMIYEHYRRILLLELPPFLIFIYVIMVFAFFYN